MVWSEAIGASIVLPADRTPGDGRNYIVIGEDVPAEVLSEVTAGIVFYNANFDTTFNDVEYWVLGINTLGDWVLIAYWADYSGGVGDPVRLASQMLRLTKGDDGLPQVNLMAPGGNIAENIRHPASLTSQQLTLLAGWGAYTGGSAAEETQLSWAVSGDGWAHVFGLVNVSTAISAGVSKAIAALPSPIQTPLNRYGTFMNTGGTVTGRVNANATIAGTNPNRLVIISPPAIAAGTVLIIDVHYPIF